MSHQEKQSKCLWFDSVKGKYFLIDNKTGDQLPVEQNGEAIKQFSSKITGKSTYQERITQSLKVLNFKKNIAFLPQQISSLHVKSGQKLYTPQINKLVGYSQFPCSLKSKDPQNSCTFFTSSLTDFKMLQSSKTEKYQQTNIKKPDTILLDKKLQKLHETESLKNSQLKKLQNEQSVGMTGVLNQQPIQYQTKLENFDNKKKYFNLIDQDQQQTFNQYQGTKMQRTTIDLFSNTLKSASNFAPIVQNQQQFVSQKFLTDQCEKEIKELQGFKMPVIDQKIKIKTKNRFNVKIKTNSEQHVQFDRVVDKQANPDLYEIKEKKKTKKLYIDPITGKTVV